MYRYPVSEQYHPLAGVVGLMTEGVVSEAHTKRVDRKEGLVFIGGETDVPSKPRPGGKSYGAPVQLHVLDILAMSPGATAQRMVELIPGISRGALVSRLAKMLKKEMIRAEPIPGTPGKKRYYLVKGNA